MPSNIQDSDILKIEIKEWNQTNAGSAYNLEYCSYHAIK
jgi:hypothetical protein